jgi:hypothetical protein|tara:strand:+ start:49 stop:669 length:621 start_codon:yes stop_codon:yes gene_type:complete
MNKDFYIIPDYDFLKDEHFIPIRNYFESSHPLWTFLPDTNKAEKNSNEPHGGQFTNTILNTNEKNKRLINKLVFRSMIPLFKGIENILPEEHGIMPIRVKCNLRYKRNKTDKTIPHVDVYNAQNDNIFSAIYYLDNADGNTILFKEFSDTSESIDINKINVLAKIKPFRNRIVIFHSSRVHAGMSPMVSDTRRMINLVFQINKKSK